jgi:glucokinase
MTNLIGIDLGGTKCSVILGGTRSIESVGGISQISNEYYISEKIVFATPRSDPSETIKLISNGVKNLLQKQDLSIENIQAVGICCGGPLDINNGLVLSPPNLPGWNEIHIVDLLEQTIGIRPMLENDANACALAEWKWGAGRGMQNIVFLTFGTGMGAGLILNGLLYHGADDMAGEIGHIRMEESGPVGYGKAGSFEGFCSGGGIAQLAGMKALEYLQMGQTVSYCPSIASINNLSAKLVGEYASSGDPFAQEVFNISGYYLGKGLSILIDILNPEAIIIGSIFIHQYKLLLSSAMDVIKKEALAISAKRCRILQAGLGDQLGDAAALGVAAYSLEA